jgi:hypothetical protein
VRVVFPADLLEVGGAVAFLVFFLEVVIFFGLPFGGSRRVITFIAPSRR